MKTCGILLLATGFILGILEINYLGNRLSWVIFTCSEIIAGAILLAGSGIKD